MDDEEGDARIMFSVQTLVVGQGQGRSVVKSGSGVDIQYSTSTGLSGWSTHLGQNGLRKDVSRVISALTPHLVFPLNQDNPSPILFFLS